MSIAARAAGHSSVADAVDSAAGPLSSLVPSRTAKLEKQVARRLQQEVGRHIGSQPVDDEMKAAVDAATLVVVGLAARDPQALATALRKPDDFPSYVRAHGGDQQREMMAEHASPLYDFVLAAASRQLIGLATSQMPRSTAEILHQLGLANTQLASIETTASRAADAAERAAHNSKQLLSLHRQTGGNHGVTADVLLVATSAARQATRPQYLPPIDRRAELGLADGIRPITPLVILGEGGSGKSVLAGDLVDWTASTCLLVPCSRVPANAKLDSVSAIDIALGNAAADGREDQRLTELLDLLPADVLLIIDTLDLLLTDDTADDLAHLIRTVAASYEVVVTSRDQEWRDLMPSELFPQHRLGLLTSEQIMAWVDAYLRSQKPDEDSVLAAFRTSVATVTKGAGRIVLGSPVRLAMTCSMYARAGSIPAGLSVAQLYKDYWTQNVVKDRRGRQLTPPAEAQLTTALEVARRIWHGSTTIFAEYVPRLGLDAAAVQDLLSSGLLRLQGTSLVGFFHQTFAEFAVATRLALLASASDLDALGRALDANSPAQWGVARYIAWLEMDPVLAIRLAEVIPRNEEGTRITLRLLSIRSAAEALVQELGRLETEDQPGLRKAFAALSDADPNNCPVILQSGLRLLRQPGPDLSAVVRTIALVLLKLPSEIQNDGLKQVCVALIDAGSDAALTDLGRLLAATINTSPDAFDGLAILSIYKRMGPAGQYQVIECFAGAPQTELAELLKVAITVECPDDAVDLLVDMAEQVWTYPATRLQLEWDNWRTIALKRLPARWRAVQVRLIARIAGDQNVWGEMLHELLDPESRIERALLADAASFVAASNPELVATTLIEAPLSPTRTIAGTLSTVLSHLGESLTATTVNSLLQLCRQLMPSDPRRVLTAMVNLAHRVPVQLGTLMTEVIAGTQEEPSRIPRPAVDSFWDVVFATVTESEYRGLRAQLEILVAGDRIADRRRRAKMVGRESFDDADGWQRLRALAFDKSLVGFADLAVKEALLIWDHSSSSPQPLVQLIGSPHGNCARIVALKLADYLPAHWSMDDVAIVEERLQKAIKNPAEDTQIAGALLGLLVKLTHQLHTSKFVEEPARRILIGYRSAVLKYLADSSIPRTSALFDQWLGTLSRIAVFILEPSEVGTDLSKLLGDVDTSKLGGRATKGLTGSIIGITNNMPNLWPQITSTWRLQPTMNQVAVAEALIRGRLPSGRDIALERAREASCPAPVAQRIHQLLET